MSLGHGASIVLSNLNFVYDYSNIKSYPGSGATLFNLIRGNNATLNGGYTYDATGKYVSFSGAQGAFAQEQTGGLGNHGTSSFTYQFLVRPKTSTSVDDATSARIYEQTGYPTSWHILSVVHNSNVPYFNFGGYSTGATSFGVNSATGIALNQWYFLTCVVDRANNKVQLYVNSTLYESNVTISGNVGTASDLRFPSSYAEISADYSIILSYTKALTANEVLQNYNAVKGRYGI
jgi:hypothetical protein